MDYRKMGSVIKHRRNALKITQEQLAEMINKSTVYISLIESGSRHPSLETLFSIAMSLNISMDMIIFDNLTQSDLGHVDEFAFLTAGRPRDEIDFVMDTIREVLRHISDGKVQNLRREMGSAKPRRRPAQEAAPDDR